MVVHMLVQKSAQNDSIKVLYLNVHLGFHFKKHEKLQKKCEEKDAFDVAIDGPPDGAIKGALLNLKFGSFVSFISYIAQNNCWHIQIRVHW